MAVLEGKKLLYHEVVTIERRFSAGAVLREVRSLMHRLLADFHPSLVAIEKTFIGRNRSAALLNVVGDELAALGRGQGRRVVTLAPSTVKKGIAGNGRASKEEVAKAVATRYPELRAYLAQSTKWRARFQANRFDAVAIGVVTRATFDRVSAWPKRV